MPPTERPIRVLVVDDHAVVREGIRSLLDEVEDVEVCGEAVDGRSAVTTLGLMARSTGLPDVVLMDVRMPHLDGPAAIVELLQDHPDLAVLVLSSFGDAHVVREAVAAGCRGYLLKDASPGELVSAIRRVHAGEMPMDPAVTRALARPFQTVDRSVAVLTPRERDIVGLVARGLSNQDIADELVISERTARTHVSNVLAKLGFASRTQVALWATEVGLQGPEVRTGHRAAASRAR